MSFYRLRRKKQNAESPSRKYRKEKVDIPSISRNWNIFENQTGPVPSVHYIEGESKELQMDRHKDVETFSSEALPPDGL